MTNQKIREGAAGTSDRCDDRTFVIKYSGSTAKYADRQTIYAQGDPADAIYYIVSGSLKVAVVSEQGREAVLEMLGPGDFFGEECLQSRPKRNSTLTARTECEVARFDLETFVRALRNDSDFSARFLAYILNENENLRENLIYQLFNSSEKRLARILLMLANYDRDDRSNVISAPITQETLASMVGTTRSRINQFMTKFRKLGYIEYGEHIRVHASLMNIILNAGVDSEDG